MHRPRAKCWLRTLDSKSILLAVVLSVVLLACAAPATRRDVTPVAPPLALHSGATLAVIGVRRGESQPGNGTSASVDDRRVGFGLTSLLAEFFFDTGKFRLVEEKDVRKREFLEDLVSTYWVEPRAPYGLQELGRVAQHLEATVLAYSSVTYTGATSQRIAIGPLSRVEQKLRVLVDVCLYDTATRVTLCREGQGEARQEGSGVVYEFRADHLDFEKNAVGRATKQAVGLAVQNLMTSITFSP